MKLKFTKTSIKSIGRGSLVLSMAALCVLLAMAQGYPCESTIPNCQSCTVSGSCHGGIGTITDCDIVSGWWYHCNSTDPDCENTPGYCNIWTRTWFEGWLMTCTIGGTTQLYGGCASEVGVSEPLNQKCDDSRPCTLGQPEDIIPELEPPYPGGTGYSPHNLTSVPADWPLDSR